MDDDNESSRSDVFEGVGDWARIVGDVDERFLDLIFCVIRVCENGRAYACNGFE